MRYSIRAKDYETFQGKSHDPARMPRKAYKHDGGPMSAWVKSVAQRLVWAREIAAGEPPAAYNALGIDQSTWRGYEVGTRQIPVALAIRLCEEWGITLEYLYRGLLGGAMRRDVEIRLVAEHPDLVLGAPEGRLVRAKEEVPAS